MNDSRLVIWNANAGGAERQRDILDELARRPGMTIVETVTSEETRHAAKSASHDYRTLIAAGGDGTINAVVNGMMSGGGGARLGVLPLGSGNDLCRTLGIPLDPFEAAVALDEGHSARIDLVEVRTADERKWCVNMATGGNSSRIDECLTDELKRRWGPLCYFRGALSVVPDLSEYDVSLRIDSRPPERFSATNVILGNGRTAAGGLEIAPRANPQDGRLEVIVISGQSAFDVVALTARLLSGDYLDSEQVTYRQARRVEIASDPPFAFSIDGDPLEADRYVFEVLPRALEVIVGPDYSPQPQPHGGADVRRSR
ncbi:MAG: diacylglycerol kinase family protein [Planctomycetaceae bacterium]